MYRLNQALKTKESGIGILGNDCSTCHGKKEWVDIESRTITLCPDCNDLKPEQAKE